MKRREALRSMDIKVKQWFSRTINADLSIDRGYVFLASVPEKRIQVARIPSTIRAIPGKSFTVPFINNSQGFGAACAFEIKLDIQLNVELR